VRGGGGSWGKKPGRNRYAAKKFSLERKKVVRRALHSSALGPKHRAGGNGEKPRVSFLQSRTKGLDIFKSCGCGLLGPVGFQ